jgi:hypothetical protein
MKNKLNLPAEGSINLAVLSIFLNLCIVNVILCFVLFPSLSIAQSQTYTANGIFTPPSGVTSVLVQCWGAGGAGANVSNNHVGGGGGGGAYASSTVAVIPGNNYSISIGLGGYSGNAGTNTTFNGATVVAAGGGSAVLNSSIGAAGGSTSASTGTIKYAGGNGANGSGANAGGGGGGAGSTGTGNNALASSGGNVKSTYGGLGGAGRTARRGNGNAGGVYGGGGGGAYTNRTRLRTGGPGADGLVIITYTCPVYSLLNTSVQSAVCPGSAAIVTLNSSTTNLPAGNYIVTYNLGAPNAATGLTVPVTVSGLGSATFTTPALVNVGTTAITITNLSSGTCNTALSSNNTTSVNVSNAGPAITVQPISQSGCIGSAVSLSATSPTASSFQWKKNGLNIVGATAPIYSISNYTASDAAAYSVNAINSCGTTSSNIVYITTRLSQPTVIATVSSPLVCAGSTVSLTASSGTTVTLLSQNFNAATNNFSNINNSTSGTPANAAFTLRTNGYSYAGNIFNSNDNSQFYLTNSDAQGNGGSTTATILQTPVLNTQGLTAASLSFYHHYRFKSGAESAKVEVSTNGSTWTVLANYTTTQGARNNFALVTINLASYLNQPAVFIRFKYDASGSWYWALDNVTITGTLSAPSYLWSSSPSGFSSSVQNPIGVSVSANTTYTATATNGAGCTNSGAVSVSVNALPAITTQPSTPTATCSGSGTQTISVAATGAGLTYQWRKNGVAVINGGVISGQGTNTLTLTAPTAANTGNYDIVVSGTCSPSVTSAAVPVSLAAATAITTAAAPVSQTVLLNNTPTNLTLSATGLSLTYQWYTNNTNCNTCGTSVGTANGGQTNTYTPSTNIAGTKYYYCVVTGTCGTVRTLAVAVTATNSNTWAGGGSSNWNTATNWLMGVVPTVTNDVIIPTGNTPYPVLSSSTAINNITINAGASVTIGSNILTINGLLSGTGTFTGSETSGMVIAGNAGTLRFTPGGTNNHVKSLIVNAGASVTLGNELNITGGSTPGNEGTLTVTSSGILNTGGHLVIKSNEFGTARIAPGNISGGYISGDVTIERYIPKNASKGWRLLASNTNGQTINAAWQEGAAGAMLNPNPGFGMKITSSGANLSAVQSLGFDTLSLGKSIFKYVQSIDMLDYVPNTNNTQLSSEHGYFVFIRGDRSAGQFGAGVPLTSTVIRSRGSIFQGNQPAVNLSAGQYAVVRNPYASRIDVRQIVRTGGLVAAYQVWDPKLAGAYGSGAFQTFTRNTITGEYEVSPGGGSYGSNGSVQNYIESGAAFYVQATGSDGSVQVTEACKTSGSQLVGFRPSSPATTSPRILYNLYANNPTSTDMVDGGFIDFDETFSNNVDVNDVRKNQNFYENFGIERGNTELVVERRQPVASYDTVFFKMYNLRRINYTLNIETAGFDTLLTTALLHDSYTGMDIPLNLSVVNTYVFTINTTPASFATDRFKVLLRQQAVLPVTFTNVKAVKSPGGITIHWDVANQSHMKEYELQHSAGGTVFNKVVSLPANSSISISSYNWLDKTYLSTVNYYRIKAIDFDGNKKYSQIVKVNQANTGLSIYPNPVLNLETNFNFSPAKAGPCIVKIANSIGQVIYSNSFMIPNGTVSQKIILPVGTPNGIYDLFVYTSGGETQTFKIMVLAAAD